MSDTAAPPPDQSDVEKAFAAWSEEVKDREGLSALTDQDQKAIDKIGRLVAMLDASAFRILEASKTVNSRSKEVNDVKSVSTEVYREAARLEGKLVEFQEWWDGQLDKVQNLLVLLTSLDMGLDDGD